MPVSTTPIKVASTTNDAGKMAVAINQLIQKSVDLATLANSNETGIGDLTTLDTVDKSSLVDAINEIVAKFDSGELVSAYIGLLSDLNTSSKTNVVSAVNEVNSKIGDISTLQTEDTSSAVAALNEIFTIVQGLDDIDSGSIVAELANKVSKQGDSMTGPLNIGSGVAGSSVPLLGLGYGDNLLPAWKITLENTGALALFTYDQLTGLVIGKKFSVNDTGRLTLANDLKLGNGSATFSVDGSILGNDWIGVGGSPDAITSILAKINLYLTKSGGTLTGKHIHSLGTNGVAFTTRDIQYSDASFKSWDETIDVTGNYTLRSVDKTTGSVTATALKITSAGNTEVSGTLKSAQTLTVGTATLDTAGNVTGSAWNSFGSSTNAITAIQNYVSTVLAAYVGLPLGGLTGQALVKASNANNDFAWGGPFAAASHTHTIANVTGLQAALDAKAALAGATFTGAVTATSFSGVGSALTALNGSNISSGTVADARLPTTQAGKTFTGITTMAVSSQLMHYGGAIELGRQDGTAQGVAYIDFHTSATVVDYNVRISATGTTGTTGSGVLDVGAASITRNGAKVYDAADSSTSGLGSTLAMRASDGLLRGSNIMADSTANSGTLYMGSNGTHNLQYDGGNYILNQGNLYIDNGYSYAFRTSGARVQSDCNLIFAGGMLVYGAALNSALDGYQSGQLTPVIGGALSGAHGLGRVPRRYAAYAVCVGAENGFGVGDEILMHNTITPVGSTTNVGTGAVVTVDASNINCRIGSNQFFSTIAKSNGVPVNLSTTNWRVILRAWA